MITSTLKIKITCSISILILMAGAVPIQAAPLHITPLLGFSAPVKSQADYWLTGYSIGLEGFVLRDNPFQFGGRVGFHRWKPDAQDWLGINGRDMIVEQYAGWRVVGEISVLARYKLPLSYSKLLHAWLDGGAGLFYVRSSEVRIKGFYETGSAAVNREINVEPDLEVVPGFNIGLTMMVIRQIQPSVRFQHIFTSDDSGFDIISVNLGLVAR